MRKLLSVLLAAALVAALLYWSDVTPGEVGDALRRLEPRTLLLAVGIQAAIYPVRAARFRALLGPPAALGPLVPVTAAHSLVAYLLPAKVGEASLVLFLKRRLGIDGSSGLAVLLLARALDFAGVTAGLALACLAIGASGRYPHLTWLTSLGLALLVPALLLAWLTVRSERALGMVQGVARRLGLERTGVGRKIDALVARLRDSLSAVRPSQLARGAAWTVPVWLLVFAYYGVLARGLGLQELGVFEAVFGASLAVLSNLLPINAFAGFGTQDAGWVFGYTALGAARDAAVSSALAFHLIYVVGIVVFGLAGYALMGGREEQGPAQS